MTANASLQTEYPMCYDICNMNEQVSQNRKKNCVGQGATEDHALKGSDSNV